MRIKTTSLNGYKKRGFVCTAFIIRPYNLVPACHWKSIVHAFGHEDLMKIYDPIVKCGCA